MHNDQTAKAVLEGNDACALTVLYAVECLFDNEFWDWEPETFRMEFDDRDIDVCEENFGALMAAIAVAKEPSFFYDANIFEDICQAFNTEPVQFDILHALCPAHIAWGVSQAQKIVEHFSRYETPNDLAEDERFDYEPIEYAVSACKHAGLVTVPDALSFVRDELERRTCAEDEFVSEVKKAWNDVDCSKLEECGFGEDRLGVQLALMATVDLYVKDQRAATRAQFKLFTD